MGDRIILALKIYLHDFKDKPLKNVHIKNKYNIRIYCLNIHKINGLSRVQYFLISLM